MMASTNVFGMRSMQVARAQDSHQGVGMGDGQVMNAVSPRDGERVGDAHVVSDRRQIVSREPRERCLGCHWEISERIVAVRTSEAG
jgi:hypothetical protein